jgi:hypothetical protein
MTQRQHNFEVGLGRSALPKPRTSMMGWRLPEPVKGKFATLMGFAHP